jgi:hypothetical protein
MYSGDELYDDEITSGPLPTTGLPRRTEAVCSDCGATFPPELVTEHERHPYHRAKVDGAARNAELRARLEIPESELRLLDGNR